MTKFLTTLYLLLFCVISSAEIINQEPKQAAQSRSIETRDHSQEGLILFERKCPSGYSFGVSAIYENGIFPIKYSGLLKEDAADVSEEIEDRPDFKKAFDKLISTTATEEFCTKFTAIAEDWISSGKINKDDVKGILLAASYSSYTYTFPSGEIEPGTGTTLKVFIINSEGKMNMSMDEFFLEMRLLPIVQEIGRSNQPAIK